METRFKGKKTEISRFKGLGEMPPSDLKLTTMDPKTRTLLRITKEDVGTGELVEKLMGRKPELRYAFITENARFVRDLDI